MRLLSIGTAFLTFISFLPITNQAQKKSAKSVSIAQAPTVDLETYFKPVYWRNLGHTRGGRSVSATGVKGDKFTYYMGITGGGVWKTEDAGQHWFNVSDGYFKTGSVGAVAVRIPTVFTLQFLVET